MASCDHRLYSPYPLSCPTYRLSYERGHFKGTAAGELLRRSSMPAALAPNVLLSFLWASMDNIVPSAFWTLAFLQLPEQAQHLATIQETVDRVGALSVRLLHAVLDSLTLHEELVMCNLLRTLRTSLQCNHTISGVSIVVLPDSIYHTHYRIIRICQKLMWKGFLLGCNGPSRPLGEVRSRGSSAAGAGHRRPLLHFRCYPAPRRRGTHHHPQGALVVPEVYNWRYLDIPSWFCS